MKTIKTLLLAGLMSFLPVKNAQAQDPVQIKGNLCLEWIADGVGNQNAKVDSSEENYMRKEFKESDTLYVCTQLDSKFGPKMAKLYNTFEDAVNYKREDFLQWPPQVIISFNKKGRITGMYRTAKGVQTLDIPEINYARKMSERYKAYNKIKEQ